MIVPANTFFATVEAVSLVGAVPVLVDCDPLTRTVSVDAVERELRTGSVAGLIAVHLYGHPADIDALAARRSRGGSLDRRGRSPSAPRRLSRRASGGARADRLLLLLSVEEPRRHRRGRRDHHERRRCWPTRCARCATTASGEQNRHELVGCNGRLAELTAAALRIKLRRLEDWTAERRRVAARYTRALAGAERIRLPYTAPWAEPVWHLYAIELDNRDAVAARLREMGVATGVHYPTPIHLQPAYAHLGHGTGRLSGGRAQRRASALPPDVPRAVRRPGRSRRRGPSSSNRGRVVMERALITGGLGLVGSHIADGLVDRGTEVIVLDDLSRGRRSNLASAEAIGNVRVVEGDIRDQALVDRLCDGVDVVFHQAALRITRCAEEPRLALDVLVGGTASVLEAAVKARRPQGRRRLVGVRLRDGRAVPDAGGAPPVRQRHAVRGCEAVQRGPAAQLPRHVRPGLRGAALLQRLRAADGHPRRLHRGARPLDRAHRRRTAAADPGRRAPDDGLHPRRGHRSGQPSGRQVGRQRRGAEHRQRRGDQPHRAGAQAARRDGRRPAGGVRPRHGRSTTSPVGWPTPGGRASGSASAPRCRWRRGCGALSSGGGPSTRRWWGRGCDPDHAPVAGGRGGGGRRRRSRLRLGGSGPQGRGLRGRRVCCAGRGVRRRDHLLHDGASPRPPRARRRARRRGRRALAVVHRYDERAPLRRRAARVRGRRPRDAEPHGGDGRAGARPVDARGDRRPPGRDAGRRGRDRGHLRITRRRGRSRTPRARSARPTAAVPSARATTSWRSASIPASSSPPERAGCSSRATRRSPGGCGACASTGWRSSAHDRHAQPVRRRRGVRGARLQLPDDRPAGRGRARAAREARRHGGRAPLARGALPRRARGRAGS